MNFTRKLINIQSIVTSQLNEAPQIWPIIKEIHQNGGVAYLVGGTVRDIILNIAPKDIDIEIHKMQLDQLEQILNNFGHVRLAGKSFGVLKIDNVPVDWSIARKDSSGRKPQVLVEPNIGTYDALKRRDLTMNAMAINLHTFELEDPFGGISDIENRVLKSPDISFFTQDPLRFFRVMQFIGRFNMQPHEELNEVCANMDLSGLSKERIKEEFDKLMLKSARPSLGIRWLQSIGRLEEILPELFNTVNIQQEYEWHPEGDVFEHSMQALDAAAKLDYKDNKEKLIVLYAAMCHDLGKATTTKLIKGRLRSFGHDIAGVKLSKKLLNRITNDKKLIDTVATLVRWHMQPPILPRMKSSMNAYKRLALRLYKSNANMRMLSLLSIADRRGRNPEGNIPLDIDIPEVQSFIDISEKLNILLKPEEPILLGRDLINNISPGPLMGEALDYAYKNQLDKNIKDKDILLNLTLKRFIKK